MMSSLNRHAATIACALALTISAQTLHAVAPDGQLWFGAEGQQAPGSTSSGSSDNQVGHINSDAGARAVADINTNSAGFQAVGLDTAAGLYFALAADGFLRCGRITNDIETGEASQLSQVQMIYSANGSATADEVNAFAVDTANHIVYVGLWGQTETTSGVLEVTYNPISGVLTSPYNAATATITDSSHVLLTSAATTPGNTFTNAVGMNYVPATHSLYYVDQTNGIAFNGGANETWPATNGIFVVSTAAQNQPPTRLTTTAQFAAGDTTNSNYISGMAVDTAKSIIYFTVNDAQTSTASSKLFYMPITGGTATQMSMPSGVTLDFATYFNSGTNSLVLDPSAQVLYISLTTPIDKVSDTSRNDSRVIQLTLSADGHSFVSGNDNFFKLDTNDLVSSYATGMAFDVLPVLSVTGATTHATEQGGNVALATGSTITDIDGTNLAGFTVQITGGTFSSNETSVNDDHLSIGGVSSGTVSGTSISFSYNSAVEKLTLTGNDTFAHYQTALSQVQYNTTGDNPTNYGNNATRTITWTASDGTTVTNSTQNVATTTLTIDAVNDPPSVTAGNTIGYTEQQASPPAVAPALTTTDPDNLNLNGATISISTGLLAGDTLNFTNQNGITGSYNSASGVLTLIGAVTIANYQTALRSITFSSTSDNPTAFGTDTTRTISFVVNDGLLNSVAAATTTINITAVNDPPSITAGATVGYTELGAAVTIDAPITVTDVDNQSLASASVSISAGFFAGDSLTFVNQNGITGSYNAATGVLSLTGSSSIANYQAALASVTFASSSHNPTNYGASVSRTISFVANDGATNSAAATATITITATNDAPVNTVPGAQSAQENIGQEIAGLSISDVDANPASDGMTTTLSVTHGTLTIASAGGAAVVGSGTATVTLTGTQNQINTTLAAANNVVYLDNINYLGPDTLTVTTNDNGHTGTGAQQSQNTVPITVTLPDRIFKDGFEGP